MSLFSYLEKILGKSSRTYEELMQSRDKDHDFGEHDVKHIARQLEPLKISAEAVEIPSSFQKLKDNYHLGEKVTHYVCSIDASGKNKHLFTAQDKTLKSEEFNELIEISDSELIASGIDPTHAKTQTIDSLPDWEGIRRINPDIYQECTERSRSPWTLYKLARVTAIGEQDHKHQLGGYPRWVANFPRKQLGDTSPPLVLEWSVSTYDHVGKVYWFEQEVALLQLIQKD